MRRGKPMGVKNIETMLTPKAFPFTRVKSNLILSCLIYGTAKVQHLPSHHTQGREARPDPVFLFGVLSKTNFQCRFNDQVDGSVSRGPKHNPEVGRCDFPPQACMPDTDIVVETTPDDIEGSTAAIQNAPQCWMFAILHVAPQTRRH